MKKKELIIVIMIILITLMLGFYPQISNYFNKSEVIIDDSSEIKDNSINISNDYIYISLTGNIINEPPPFKFKKGITWQSVKEIIVLYVPNNSKLPDYPLDYQFFADTTININKKDENIENTLINVNTASLDELKELAGIGDKKANKIIEYRKTKKILSFDELRKVVGGLSDADFEEIKTKAVCQ